MSHKIAKAQRKAERHVATPNDMHLLIIESNRQRRRADAHKLKITKQRRAKERIKPVIRSWVPSSPLIVERPIRALWRGMFKRDVAVPAEFIRRYIRWSKAEMDAAAQ
jgi:hypothetical protein